MSYFTYILYSEKTNRIYIGSTNNLEDRIHRHNSNRNQYTKGRGSWKLLYNKSFELRSEALNLEKFLKAKKDPARVLQWIDEQTG